MRFLSLLVLGSIVAAPCWGMFMSPENVPVKRLVKNLLEHIEREPELAENYYTLGRVYYLGFVLKSDHVPAYEARREGEIPTPAKRAWQINSFAYRARYKEAEKRALAELELDEVPERHVLFDGTPEETLNYLSYEKRNREILEALNTEEWQPEIVAEPIVLNYIILAQSNLERAVALESNNGLYWLGLASLREQIADFAEAHKAELNSIKPLSRNEIIDTYWTAFERMASNDSKLEYKPIAGIDSLVSFEAGQAWLRLNGQDEEKRFRIEQQIEVLKNLKQGPITPLLVAKSDPRGSQSFMSQKHIVPFDLLGFGDVKYWNWIDPNAGFLVWDPKNEGQVTSGRQLFGNYTFQIFWSDGFAALSSLDNNFDQVLRKDELLGLSLWFDENSNGVSEIGETQPLSEYGITELRWKELESEDGMLLSRSGVLYRDGHMEDLWDWLSTSMPD